MADVLGIEVTSDRLCSWVAYLAPDPQPFVITDDDRLDDLPDAGGVLSREVRDSFRLWSAPGESRIVWLTRTSFLDLSPPTRSALVRSQILNRKGDRPGVGRVPTVRGWSDVLSSELTRREADGHRFLWWPELVASDPAAILGRLVSTGRLHSQHTLVQQATWDQAADILPRARSLGGSWAALGEQANCFSTVMDAAGADASGACNDTGVFSRWLNEACRPCGRTDAAGTVLVWREEGELAHAAVCIGDGWCLEKPSQEWHAPRAITRTADVIRTTRTPGLRLERHSIVS